MSQDTTDNSSSLIDGELFLYEMMPGMEVVGALNKDLWEGVLRGSELLVDGLAEAGKEAIVGTLGWIEWGRQYDESISPDSVWSKEYWGFEDKILWVIPKDWIPKPDVAETNLTEVYEKASTVAYQALGYDCEGSPSPSAPEDQIVHGGAKILGSAALLIARPAGLLAKIFKAVTVGWGVGDGALDMGEGIYDLGTKDESEFKREGCSLVAGYNEQVQAVVSFQPPSDSAMAPLPSIPGAVTTSP